MNIYVGNLSFDETEETLQAEFAAHGEVASARIITDRFSGRSRGFGFVEMADDGARAAIESLNDTEIDGRNIVVNEAQERKERGPRRF